MHMFFFSKKKTWMAKFCHFSILYLARLVKCSMDDGPLIFLWRKNPCFGGAEHWDPTRRCRLRWWRSASQIEWRTEPSHCGGFDENPGWLECERADVLSTIVVVVVVPWKHLHGKKKSNHWDVSNLGWFRFCAEWASPIHGSFPLGVSLHGFPPGRWCNKMYPQ